MRDHPTKIQGKRAKEFEAVGALLWGMRDDHKALTEWAVENLQPDLLKSIVDQSSR